MRIFAFHLLNDYSGSPKVLMQLVKGWVSREIDVKIVTCAGHQGFLSDIPGVDYRYFRYTWAANPYLRLVNLVMSQLRLLLMLLLEVKKGDIVYVNTVLPFGAAFLGKIKGCKVIYHIHETTMKPALLKKILFGIAHWAADERVYVSQYLAQTERGRDAHAHVLYNAIEDDFLKKAQAFQQPIQTPENVLMVCSLKAYKGVNEFVASAAALPQFQFRLVLNAAQSDIDAWLPTQPKASNLTVFATQTDLHPHYQWADVVLNLSRPDGWVETFGLTILEGMAYGLPALVPPVGGVTELVEDGSNGFLVDSRNAAMLMDRLTALLTDEDGYRDMCVRARERVVAFSEARFLEQSLEILTS